MHAGVNSRRVVLSIADPEKILKLSVVEINSVRLMKPKLRIPEENGVMSLLMGSIDRKIRCSTCENDMLNCPGHIGHIAFAAPIYHFGFVKNIAKLLRCVCYWCARCPSPIPTLQRNQSRDSSSTSTDEKRRDKFCCNYCSGYSARYAVEGHRIRVSFPEASAKKSRFLPASKALSIFERALDNAVHPELAEQISKIKNALLTVLIVPPPCVRPSSMQDDSKARGQDDLTRLLINIVSVIIYFKLFQNN